MSTKTCRESLPVLLVDDDELVAGVIADMLLEDGYAVRRAASAEAALALLKRERFSLVVCDIGLPGGLDGLQLARKLKKAGPKAIVLLMTGHGLKAEEAAAEFLVLHKPFGMQELSRLMDYLLQEGAAPSDAGPPNSDLDRI